ncbi:MAG: arginine deiminase-related protein [Gammaproteobacteria bacterium]|nr:arginine deiminase-related protein [Gammaproteobacteria bacterium]
MHDHSANDIMTSVNEPQLASTVMMIRPAGFESNPLTAASNRFQGRPSASPEEQQANALREFDGLVSSLREAGIEVIVVDDTPEPHTPDAIFPNNWISMHADGRVVLYPMEAENRRTERRDDIIDQLGDKEGRVITEVIDLSEHEVSGHYLEGTGSMVLDRANRVAYACVSTRTHLDPLGDFAQRLGYDVVAFDAVDSNGVPIYHTNVLMNVGEELAVVCDAAIVREDQREAVLTRLRETGHDIVSLSYAQLDAFAGNMLELRNRDGERVIAMSQRAFASLNEEQRAKLAANGRIVSAAIDNIESSAGGSVRCMLAEVHLPTEGSNRQ